MNTKARMLSIERIKIKPQTIGLTTKQKTKKMNPTVTINAEKKIALLIVAIIIGLCFSSTTYAQTYDYVTGDFRSKNSGSWASSSTWEVYNATTNTWSQTSYPGQNPSSSNVYIQANHTITFNTTNGTYSFGDLYVMGHLKVAANTELKTTTNLVLDGGDLEWTANANLTLPVNASLSIINNGSILIPDQACNANKTLHIGEFMYSSCSGGGAYADFATVSANGGTLKAVPTATPSTINPGETVQFTGSYTGFITAGTADATYAWSGTGPGGYTFSSTTQNPTASNFTIPGIYTFSLTVARGERSDTKSLRVTVLSPCATRITDFQDNFAASFHAGVAKGSDGYYLWGENTGFTTPTKITPGTNGFPGTSGSTVFKASAGSGSIGVNSIVYLTSENKIYQKGTQPITVAASTNTAIDLPTGVSAASVTSFWANANIVAIVANGKAYVHSLYSGTVFGDGKTSGTGWGQSVRTDATTEITDFISVRGDSDGSNYNLMGLTSSGNLYVWGRGTTIPGNNSPTNRPYATKIEAPSNTSYITSDLTPTLAAATGNPIMIQVNVSGSTVPASYYVLYSSGELWAYGDNAYRQLGDFTTTSRPNWIRVKKTSSEFANVAYFSTEEHDTDSYNQAVVQMILNNGSLYSFGTNSDNLQGIGSVSGPTNPTISKDASGNLDGSTSSKSVRIVETGGHISFIIKDDAPNKLYMAGHGINGSLGDGTTSDHNLNVYTASSTNLPFSVCDTPPLTPSPSAGSASAVVCHPGADAEFVIPALQSVYDATGWNNGIGQKLIIESVTSQNNVELRYNEVEINSANLPFTIDSYEPSKLVFTLGTTYAANETFTYVFVDTDGVRSAIPGTISYTFNPVTPAPVGNSTQRFCNATSNPTIQDLINRFTGTGGTILVYDQSGIQYALNTELVHYADYYVSQTVTTNGTACESERIKVQVLITDGPIITKYPMGRTYCLGEENVTPLSVIAESAVGGTLTYQWYEASSLTDNVGVELNGETNNTLNLVVPTTVRSKYYYVTVTDSECGSFQSHVVEVDYIDCRNSDGLNPKEDKDDDNDGILDVDECDINVLTAFGTGKYITPSIIFGVDYLNKENVDARKDLSEFFGFAPESGVVVVEIINATTHSESDVWVARGDKGFPEWKVTGTNAAWVIIEHGQRIYPGSSRGMYSLDGTKMYDIYDIHDIYQIPAPDHLDLRPGLDKGFENNYYFIKNTTQQEIIAPVMFSSNNNHLHHFAVTSDLTVAQPDYMIKILPECDTDMDGIPNRMDTDSDGDGCPDAIEGTENVRLAQLYPLDLDKEDPNYAYRGQIRVKADGVKEGTPDEIISLEPEAYGVPELVNPASANTSGEAGAADNTDLLTPTSEVGQGKGDSQNAAISTACNNYWMGNETDTDPNKWDLKTNWTQWSVPATGQDIEFATVANFGTAAVNHLHLAQPGETKDRIIGSLINNSNQNLVITTGDKLTINGTVTDNNTAAGTIVVQSSPSAPTGTLILANEAYTTAGATQSVHATVQFYNKAYTCTDCPTSSYNRQWQYFGIPVASTTVFPNSNLTPPSGTVTVNEWMEHVNGNKWVNVPDGNAMTAFRGYEITNSSNALPADIYSFTGTLNVGNAVVNLTKTDNMNYSGMNLVGNSYTAAIPINNTALMFSGTMANQNVYLFNAGTRDEWRKMSGSTVTGIASGQYTSAPFNVAGQAGLPSQIPSMHAFMVQTDANNTLTIRYSELEKNKLISETGATPGVAWRSSTDGARTVSTGQNPYLVMDVIGTRSADRVWLFENPSTTRGFDNGWDGHKMPEAGIAQLYVAGNNSDKYQVATVPDLTGTEFGFVTDADENYTVNFAVTPDVESRRLYLRDLRSKQFIPIRNGVEVMVQGRQGDSGNRFRIVSEAAISDVLSSVEVFSHNRIISVANHSDENCVAYVYDTSGRLSAQRAVKAKATEYINIPTQGVYVVKVIGATVNEVKRVVN